MSCPLLICCIEEGILAQVGERWVCQAENSGEMSNPGFVAENEPYPSIGSPLKSEDRSVTADKYWLVALTPATVTGHV